MADPARALPWATHRRAPARAHVHRFREARADRDQPRAEPTTTAADPDPGPRRRRARVAAGDRGRRRCRRSRTALPVGRDRAAGQPGARRLRRQPRDEARPAVPPGAARDRPGARRRRSPRTSPTRRSARRSRRSRSRRPGFLNLRLTDAALEATIGAVLADPAGWGRVAGGRARGAVNVEFVSANPTGPLTIGNARGAFVGDLLCRVLEAGGQTVTREYYFNDFGRPGRQPRRVRRSRSGAASPIPEDGYHGDYVEDLAPRAAGRRPGGGRGRRAPIAADVVGRWAAATRPRGDRGQPRPARRPLRRLEERGLAPRRGLGRAGDRAAAGRRPRLRAGRRDLVPLDGLRRRQGPGDHPVQRPADLLRRRHRLRHREVQPRLRPPDLHLGRRPPRDGGPGPQRRRGDGLRPGRGPDAAHSLGPLHPRRRRRSR